MNDVQQKRRLLLVKYGGSAVTIKDRLETLHPEALHSCADHVSELLRNNGQDDYRTEIVIVHGAGSFGHFHAKQYGLKSGGDGSRGNAGWQYGLSLTRQSVLKLNRSVVDVLISKGVPAVSVDPFPSTRTQRRTSGGGAAAAAARIIPDANHASGISHPGVLDAIRDLLDAGLVPVLHGDVVLDASQNCSILSGDSIISWLSHCFHADSGTYDDLRVVFLTDVAGVFDKAPHLPGATLIPHIIVSGIDSSMNVTPLTETAAHDVTGGIGSKLKTAVDIARLGIPVFIVRAGSSDSLAVMRGQELPAIGTKVSSSSICDLPCSSAHCIK